MLQNSCFSCIFCRFLYNIAAIFETKKVEMEFMESAENRRDYSKFLVFLSL